MPRSFRFKLPHKQRLYLRIVAYLQLAFASFNLGVLCRVLHDEGDIHFLTEPISIAYVSFLFALLAASSLYLLRIPIGHLASIVVAAIALLGALPLSGLALALFPFSSSVSLLAIVIHFGLWILPFMKRRGARVKPSATDDPTLHAFHLAREHLPADLGSDCLVLPKRVLTWGAVNLLILGVGFGLLLASGLSPWLGRSSMGLGFALAIGAAWLITSLVIHRSEREFAKRSSRPQSEG